MNNVDRYRNILKSLEYNYRGIELSHIVALKIWGEARGRQVFLWRHIANVIKAYNVKELKLPDSNGFFATYMEEWRKDHYELYNTVISRLSITPARNDLFNIRKCLSFHPLVIIKLFKHFIKSHNTRDLSIKNKIQWFSEYVFLCNTILELDKIDFSGVNKYLSMCHVLGLENLLTQYLRKKGITTYSLEEGMYMVYKKNFVIGSIAYELFATDHLLCWGQYTKDQYVEYGIAANRIDVAGYPKGQVLAQQKELNPYKKCLVLLAGPIFGDVNNKLLLMLESLKGEFEITLKSHPVNYNEISNYAIAHSLNIIPKERTIIDCLSSNEFDFCIAVNTTAYYESWMYGIPCIRYNDERFDIFNGFDDLFKSREEMMTIINKYRKSTIAQEVVKNMLEYAIGFGIDNYDRIING